MTKSGTSTYKILPTIYIFCIANYSWASRHLIRNIFTSSFEYCSKLNCNAFIRYECNARASDEKWYCHACSLQFLYSANCIKLKNARKTVWPVLEIMMNEPIHRTVSKSSAHWHSAHWHKTIKNFALVFILASNNFQVFIQMMLRCFVATQCHRTVLLFPPYTPHHEPSNSIQFRSNFFFSHTTMWANIHNYIYLCFALCSSVHLLHSLVTQHFNMNTISELHSI